MDFPLRVSARLDLFEGAFVRILDREKQDIVGPTESELARHYCDWGLANLKLSHFSDDVGELGVKVNFSEGF